HGITYADGDTIFDVGANAGFFSLFASQVCQPAKIYAFEPIPDNCELYRINTALHSVEAEILQCGVADQPGTANFVFYRNAAGLSGRASGREADIRELKTFARHNLAVELGSQQPDLSEQEVEGALDEYLRGEERTCRLVTLSQIIAERGVERIDLLKIDVERSEVKVLEGLAEDDWPKIRQVILEVHSRELLAATRALLEAHGFRIAVDELMSLDGASESESLRVYMVYATRPEAEAETGRQPVSPEEDTLALSWVDLRTFIGERLPDYMVPAIFTPLDSLPLTPNGKVDRSALPAPHGVLRRQEADYVPPKSALERQLASAWQDVLKVDRIGRHENFFEAGGTSLLLVQLHRELQQTTERELSLVDLFRHPTIESMATFLQTGPQERANVAESRDRARKQAEALTGSNARERQRQFLQRRRRGRRARPRHPHG
ncbi:MAG: FkbM family methyltransferase, partial [Acidobacteriota bacterium]